MRRPFFSHFRSKQDRTEKPKSAVFSRLFVSHLKNRGYDFLTEDEFGLTIQRERKRTERSKRPFLLTLVDASDFQKSSTGRTSLLEKIALSLCTSSRKTDVKGWYKEGSIIGVVFVDLAELTKDIETKLLEKISRGLSTTLRPDELQRLKVSFHPYPESEHSRDSRSNLFDLCLYPDLSRRNRSHSVSLVFKRFVDVVGSALALSMISPLFVFIALAIKATSAGPVFFRQPRIRLGGGCFTLYKFRSMYENSDPADHINYIRKYINDGHDGVGPKNCTEERRVYKIVDDPRVTPFGRVLRRTSLDELPQFFNVLKGDMALVGPRPPIPYECDNYDVWHRRRILEAKPGLTGLWQVKGRSSTTFDDMVRMDLQYAKDRSFWLDLRILFLTPVSVLHGKGAY